eukprot:922024-Prymnesium_polylepis.1
MFRRNELLLSATPSRELRARAADSWAVFSGYVTVRPNNATEAEEARQQLECSEVQVHEQGHEVRGAQGGRVAGEARGEAQG